MRINQTKRIYMNEADGSSGNGAGSSPPAPAAPTAAPTAPEPPAPLTAESVATIVATAVDAKLKAFENGLFANARKAGLLGKEKSAPETPPTAPSVAVPASTGLSMADVELIVQRGRVLNRAAIEHKLTDAQVKRMNSALKADAPEDVSTWTAAYLADLGLVRTTAPSTPDPVPQPTVQPISDRGSPAPGGAVFWEREFAENPVGMSAAARQAMDAKHGVEVARRMRVEAAQTQLQRIKATPK